MTQLIVDHLWQSTLFVVVAWLLAWALRRNAARVRYWVWFAASIKFLIPFSLLTALGSLFSWRDSTPIPVDESFLSTVQQVIQPLDTPAIVLRAPEVQAFDYLPILLTIWIVGGIVLLLRWGRSWWRVAAAVRNAQPVEIRAPIAVKSTSIMSEPGVVGVLRPVLLLPDGIASRLTPVQLQAVLAHELCHVRRRDNLTAAVHMLVEVLFWFHPLVWWIGARLVDERERACDEGVVELGNEPQAYAEGILKVCQFYMESKLACVAGVSGSDLKRRVEAIMSNRLGESLGFAKRSLIALCLTAAIAAPIALGLIAASPRVVEAQQANGFTAVDSTLSIELVPDGQGPHDDDSTVTLVRRGQTVRDLIVGAYQLQPQQVAGAPLWIDQTRFDVVSRGSKSSDLDMRRLNEVNSLERSLLADRFGLKFHREMRPTSVYVLGLSPSGRNTFRLHEEAPNYTGGLIQTSIPRPELEIMPRMMRKAPMRSLAWHLAIGLDSIVLDHTGLSGAYSFELDERAKRSNVATLLENQLGLRLEQRVESVEVLVVDAIQQPPAGAAIRVSQESPNTPRLIVGDERMEVVLNPLATTVQFNGQKLKLKVVDLEVRDTLNMLSRVGGRTIVLDPSIQGRISIDAVGIAWDKVLDEIVRFKGWTASEVGGAIQISAPTSNRSAALAAPASSSSHVIPTTWSLRASQRTEVGGMQLTFDGATMEAANMTLKELIQAGYDPNLPPSYITGGPLWIDQARFDATIKLGSPSRLSDLSGPNKQMQLAGMQAQQLRGQLRKLLNDEFKLVVRNEKRDAGYRLDALPSGARLTVATSEGSVSAQLREIQDGLMAQSVSTQDLCGWLAKRLSAPVMNRTALYGRYDFEFRLSNASGLGEARRLSAALSEQLGLELTTVRVETLVIDRAEKPAKASAI